MNGFATVQLYNDINSKQWMVLLQYKLYNDINYKTMNGFATVQMLWWHKLQNNEWFCYSTNAMMTLIQNNEWFCYSTNSMMTLITKQWMVLLQYKLYNDINYKTMNGFATVQII